MHLRLRHVLPTVPKELTRTETEALMTNVELPTLAENGPFGWYCEGLLLPGT
jgi:hypothetical protein